MALKVENSKLIIRNDTGANFNTVDPILLKGEMGVEHNTENSMLRIKIGDGTSRWNELDYIVDEGALRDLIELVKNNAQTNLENESKTRLENDTALDTRIGEETSRAIEAENVLQGNIDTCKNNLETDMTNLGNLFSDNLESEKEAREADVNLITQALEAEVQTRFDNDTTLDNKIDTEIENRIEAENNLQETIDTLGTILSGALDSAIETEVESRAEAINVISGLLDNEKSDRTINDTILQEQIDQETETRNLEISGLIDSDAILQKNIDTLGTTLSGALDLAIETEVESRAEAINLISGLLDTEKTDRTNADTALQEQIDQETETRNLEISGLIDSDAILQKNIDTLGTTLSGALDLAIETEVESRAEAINLISGLLDNEKTDRINEDTTLQNSIDLETENRIVAVSGVLGNLNSLSESLNTDISGLIETDNTLQSNIDTLSEKVDTEIENRNTLISGVENQLDQEIENRNTSISGLSNDLNTFSGLLDTEKTDRTNADTALQEQIDQETETRNLEISGLIDSDTTLQNNIDTKITINKLPYAISDIEINSTSSSVAIDTKKINTNNGNELITSLEIPISTIEQVGLMSNADVLQIQALTAEINSLKGIKKNYVVFLDTETPTQDQLLAVFQTVSELEEPLDGMILWDQTYNKEYIYFESDELFHDRGNSTIAFATNNSPGVVQGSASQGKVYVENDGTMSLNGYDLITSSISGLETNTLEKNSIVDNLTSENTDKPLSAKQGQVLKGEIDQKQNQINGIGYVKASENGNVSFDNNTYTKETDFNSHTSNTNNPHNVTASQLGLENVNNTSDNDKPISTATQTALNTKINIQQNTNDVGKYLVIGSDGHVIAGEPSLLENGSANDTVIGNRTLNDGPGETALLPTGSASLTEWLQGIRNNLQTIYGYGMVRYLIPDIGAYKKQPILSLSPNFMGQISVVVKSATTDLSIYWDVFVSSMAGSNMNIYALEHRKAGSKLYYEIGEGNMVNIFLVRDTDTNIYGGYFDVKTLNGNWTPLVNNYEPSNLTAVPVINIKDVQNSLNSITTVREVNFLDYFRVHSDFTILNSHLYFIGNHEASLLLSCRNNSLLYNTAYSSICYTKFKSVPFTTIGSVFVNDQSAGRLMITAAGMLSLLLLKETSVNTLMQIFIRFPIILE